MLASLLFLIIAILYSSVGFGGGSSYIAILALFDYPYQSIPILALICNLIVVSGGVFLFHKRGHFNWKLFWPFAVSSIPLSFIGGQIPISKETFLLLLGGCLFLVGVRLLLIDRIKANYRESKTPKPLFGIIVGGVLGFISGLVGIGGGIFLAPILLTLRWGLPKQVAATAAMFIFLNSIAGLAGQLTKHSGHFDLSPHWPLFIAVFLGGQLGSRLGSGQMLSQRLVKDLTAVLVIFVAARILLT